MTSEEKKEESNKNNNSNLNQREEKKELEIIAEEKNINFSEENGKNKANNKSISSSISNSYNKNNIKYPSNFLLENDDNNKINLINYLSDGEEKNININEEKIIKSNNKEKNSNLNQDLIKINKSEKKEKKENDNDIKEKSEPPLSNRLNININLKKSTDNLIKEKEKKSSSKQGALKILELITSKKKEKEIIEKKKEELLIETFKKARNDKDQIPEIKKNNDSNNIINFNSDNIKNEENKKEIEELKKDKINNKNDNIITINKKIPNRNENKNKKKLDDKKFKKFIKKQINNLNSKNKNSFSISKDKIKIQTERNPREKDIMKYKNEKKQTKTIDNQNKNPKNKNKANIDITTIDNKNNNQSLQSNIYTHKKPINPRGSSFNKLTARSLLSKSNININNVNYINNINTIIKKNYNDNEIDNYNKENNIIKLKNDLNINNYNENNSFNLYNNFDNEYNYINNYSTDLIKKVNNQNNNNKYKKNNFKNNSNYSKSNKMLISSKTKNILYKHNTNLNEINPNRIQKNNLNVIHSIYNNSKINQYNNYKNENLSQRYYIYNNNQLNNSNDMIMNNYKNSNRYFEINNNDDDINNGDIDITESNNNSYDNYLMNYKKNIKNKSSISINIEDLMIFEDKFSEIIFFMQNKKEVKNQCFDFLNYFYNCSLFNRIEKIFKIEKNIEQAKQSLKLKLISVMICYEFSFDYNEFNKIMFLLNEILDLSYNNLMIICENILDKIIPENQQNIWVKKLNNLVQNYNKNKLENISNNKSHIEQIISNSLLLSRKINNILTTYTTDYSHLILSLFKKIHQKTYTEIYDFFLEYIYKNQNMESSILAPILLNSNPNFISFRPPYIHTERIKSYTLILDLNETIVNFQQTNFSQGILRLRPFLLEFLEKISFYYEIILFTTSTEFFAKPIISAIEENKKFFDFVFYREYAIIVGNDFVKDLTRVGRTLDSTIIVDNMPQNFRLQKENGIHIKPFYAQEPNDNTLIYLMDILINIAKSGIDAREGLAKFRNDIVQKISSNIYKYNNI